MSRRALVIQHEEPTPPGLIAPWLHERGYEVETLRIDEQDPHDLDPRTYELIVSLGSELGAYQDDIEWIKHEMDFLAEAQEAEVPILGVCFGGQILARVLGGDVFRSEQEEIGWLPVGTSDPDLVPDGPWFQWHFDTFTAPPGATVVAANEAGPQAYVIGRSLGVPVHPEERAARVGEWVLAYRDELVEHGVDQEPVLAGPDEGARRHEGTAGELLDAGLERVARPRAGA